MKPISKQMHIAITGLRTDFNSSHQTNPQLRRYRCRLLMGAKGVVICDCNRREPSRSSLFDQCCRRIRPIALKCMCMKVDQSLG